MQTFLDAFDRLVSALKQIPPDIHALNLILVGALMILRGHKEEGQLVIGGGLAMLKGHPTPPTQS